MEYLTEERLKFLLHKEWLVRIDNSKSVPYLFKFYASTVDQCCYLMITDTKEVWGEVLTSKQFARRWRNCNPAHAPLPTITDEEEDEWRDEVLSLLGSIHSLGGITDLMFDVVDSRNADFAFELGSDEFKWRWETYSLGPKVSADVLSKHLIMPLISVTHLSFSSADPVSELSEADLEKVVDKVGRTARRTVDTHVKHAISRPRVATTLRRMTAMFNFLPDMPPILSDVETPKFKQPTVPQRPRAQSKAPHHAAKVTSTASSTSEARVASEASEEPPSKSGVHDSSADIPQKKKASAEDSETERSSDEEQTATKKSKVEEPSSAESLPRQGPSSRVLATGSQAQSAHSSQGRTTMSAKTKAAGASSDSGPSSSPTRPAKKTKRAQEPSSSDDSDEDSEAERRRRLAQLKSSSARGAKQPLKRGGRRF